MNPRVVAVRPSSNHTLTIEFTNGEVRVFDVRPYLDRGIFRALKDLCVFSAVRASLGSVQWPGGQDFCPDTLYEDSVPAGERQLHLPNDDD